MIKRVRKRNGKLVPFEEEKISRAIERAQESVDSRDRLLRRDITNEIVVELEKKFNNKPPDVETIQDMVEEHLMAKQPKVAKAYILYRQKRIQIREAKKSLGIEDELKLPLNSLIVLAQRYLKRDENRKITETPKQMFQRVAKVIASVDRRYGATKEQVKETEQQFYEMMANFKFLPNSPTLMNAGNRLGQLSACFVLPVEDSIEGIFEAIKQTAIIHQSGGGTGFSFSRLRPENDIVIGTGGVASGPIPFMEVFNSATEAIKQGGKRRGANMGVLRVDHPDIMNFVGYKYTERRLKNFNLSVAVTDKFMKTVLRGGKFELINPRTRKIVQRIEGNNIWTMMKIRLWEKGGPGIIFIDRINRTNPTPRVGEIESVNPCGEQPLLPYESCNLGSINLSKMVRRGDRDNIPKINWDKLRETVETAIHFLDNVIDANKFPMKQIEKITKANRKIGLGVMGFADMLIQLGISYNSEDAVNTAEKVMKFIQQTAKQRSVELGKERGNFPNFPESTLTQKYSHMRNATVTTIAPTGTIGVIAGCSGGIEPLFAVTYTRRVKETLGRDLTEMNEIFETLAIKEEFYGEDLLRGLANKKSIQDMEEIPKNVRKLFVTYTDITPEWHVRIQSAFQKHVDNAVSKTINFPNSATPDDMEKAFLLAYKLGCKGITAYRDGSREHQIITEADETCPICNI